MTEFETQMLTESKKQTALLDKILKAQDNTFRLFNQYNSEYLEVVAGEGLNNEGNPTNH